MVNFFYNQYNFETNKNYLIFYRGNFGPVSRGHYNLVEKYIHYPNVKYLISQIGSEKRHGVPYVFNRKMWKIYIEELLPQDKIYLKKMRSPLDVLDFLNGIDFVIFLRGREEENEDNNKKEKERLRKYSKLIQKLERRGVQLDFLIIDRPEINSLSSTKFIEALIQNKTYEDLKYFLPPNLSYSASMYIINKLRNFSIH